MLIRSNMLRSIAVLTLLFASVSASLSEDDGAYDMTPSREEPVVATEASVPVGKIFQIKLQSSVGTAYWWQCASADEAVADVKDLGAKRSDGSNDTRVGYRIARSFAISAINTGSTTIKCELISMHDPADRTLNLILKVQ